MRTLSLCLISVGVALIIAFGIVAIEAGMIVDETGADGRLLAGQAFVGLSGVSALLLGLILFIVWAKRRYPVEAPDASLAHLG